jgi:hypothetical protein
MPPSRQATVLEVQSPLHHGSDENTGVDNTFRRAKHVHPEKGAIELPVVSGNTIRHTLRAALSTHLLQAVGLYEEDEVPLNVYYVLYSGGALKKGASTRFVEIATRRDVRDMLPHVSLLGTALKGGMMEGKLQIGHAVPYTERSQPLLYPSVDQEPGLSTHHEALDWYYQTRSKDGEKEEQAEQVDADGDPHQMKYQYEVLAPGTPLHHWTAIDTDTQREHDAWAKAHQLLHDNATTLGGKEGVGFGQVTWPYTYPDGDANRYEDYVEDNAEDIRAFLLNELADLA